MHRSHAFHRFHSKAHDAFFNAEHDWIVMTAPSPKVVVIGQGYVGLPVAMRAVEAGFDVVGVETDPSRVTDLQQGRSYVDDISPQTLQNALNSMRYVPTDQYSSAQGFEVAVITVPTPLRESLPDLSYIEDCAKRLSAYLRPGATVILESTTYPGTTEELLVPILEEGSGLLADEDFFVGFSPERIDPGNKTWGFVETPKVVAGTSPQSLAKVKAFYDLLVNETVPVSGTKEAELTKLLENTFRHVNIALVNELAVYAHQLGIDIWEAIDAAATKPFGFMKFTPGPGVGGHCLPVDPSYLSWEVRRKLGRSFRFVEVANDVNDHMPDYVVERMVRVLNTAGKPLFNSKVLIVGLAYKKNTGDTREAPSGRVIELLLENGAVLEAADPHVTEQHWPKSVARVELSVKAIDNCDAILVLTDHDGLEWDLLATAKVPILDTKNCIRGDFVERL